LGYPLRNGNTQCDYNVKKQESVKIIASNNIYSPTNTISRDWFNSHPCVIYIGDIKPTMSKDQKIVEL
jgi:hypothetical protein